MDEEEAQNSAAWKMGKKLANLVNVPQKHPMIPTGTKRMRMRNPTGLETYGIKKNKSSSKNSRLMSLPSDILIDIILRLPAISVCRIRCVSKTLNGIIVDIPSLVTNHMRSLLTNNTSAAEVPQLVLLDKSPLNHLKLGFFSIIKALPSVQYDGDCNILKQRKHVVVSELLTSTQRVCNVHFVFYNLLCFKEIHKYGDQCFLFNFLKGEVLKLPTSNVQVPAYRSGLELFDWYAMGFDTVTSTFKIVHVSGNPSYENLVAQVLVLGTSTWQQISSVPPCRLSHKNVSAYGDMHCVLSDWMRSGASGETSNIISFDFKKEEFYWTLHPPLKSNGGSDLTYLQLLTLRGSLAIVDAWSDVDIDIWVLKNKVSNQWERQYCIRTYLAKSVRLHGYVRRVCGEWEHGIFFKEVIRSAGDENGSAAIFVDLRAGSTCSVKHVECPLLVKNNWTIISYTGSLISLKDYGKLEKQQLGVHNQVC